MTTATAVRERPILFSGPMNRAILEGRKSVTRRVVRRNDIGRRAEPHEWNARRHHPDMVPWEEFGERQGLALVKLTSGSVVGVRCPYGQPGDRLWVRHASGIFEVYYKPIPGWEDRYAAGTDGIIYRIDGGTPVPLKGSPTSKGYLTVSLRETKAIHVLVCETYYGPKPFPGAQVRHMDGDRSNNLPENLDWGTHEQNWSDRRAHGRGMGEEHHAAKLTAQDVAAIRDSKLPQRALASEYGVSQSTIGEVRKGDTWGTHEPAPRNQPAFKLWKSSIHMPRWASRISLEVTEVRVERLQEITEVDAIAEGVQRFKQKTWIGGTEGARTEHSTARAAFRSLWDSLNAARGYGWDANPWVWVVRFRRVRA